MNKQVAQKFKTGVDVTYRSFQDPRPQEGKLKFDIKFSTGVTVDLPMQSAEMAELAAELDTAPRVVLKDLTKVKARNYADGHSFEWGICVTEKSGAQHSIVFRMKEERDFLDEEMRNLLRGGTARAEKKEPASVNQKFRTVKRVDIQEPPPKPDINAVCIALELEPPCEDGSTKALIEIPKALPIEKWSPEYQKGYERACQQKIVQRVHELNILSTEATSLYRLVKALAGRKQVREHTAVVLKKIDSLNFDEYAKDHPVHSQLVDTQNKVGGKQLQVNEELDSLKHELHHRLGTSGIGAQLVTGLLVHNIDKMKAINEKTSAIRFREHHNQTISQR